MRVLVTGAGGFVGSHIAHHLAAIGTDVIAVYRNNVPKLPKGSPSIELLELDLAAPISAKLKFDAIVHAAATSERPGITVDDMVRDNIVATRNLWRFSVETGCNRVIYLSSLSIHGSIDQREVTPDTPVHDPSTYGLTKHIGEIMLSELAGASRTNLAGVSIRLPGVLGPRATHHWLAATLDKLKRGSEVRIFNPDAPFNNTIHADDLAKFVAHLITTGRQGYDAFPVGCSNTMSIHDVVQYLARGLDTPAKVSIEAPSQPAFTISNEQACRHGYCPVTIENSLDRFIAESETAP